MVEPERLEDQRGFFARTWCRNEFERRGLNTNVVQCNISFNRVRGTFRGMHYQQAPHEEAKLVRCTRGAILDIIVDLRPESPTYRDHVTAELSGENRRMLYVPERFAHGFLTLEPDSEVFYQMSEFYVPGAGTGVRWNDPVFSIKWPDMGGITVADKDQTWPLLE
jgi:dTDP-4-dehydrorhamnose 3,5-epimerase